jgi:hypothetical protein
MSLPILNAASSPVAPNLNQKASYKYVTEFTVSPNLHIKDSASAPVALNVNQKAAYKYFTEFTLFPNLPVEIRLKVWKASLPPPRLLRLKSSQCFLNREQPGDYESTAKPEKETFRLAFDTEDTELGVVGACQESRLAALKTFTIHLPSSTIGKEIWLHPGDVAFIDGFETLALDLHNARHRGLELPHHRQVLGSLQTIAVNPISTSVGTGLAFPFHSIKALMIVQDYKIVGRELGKYQQSHHTYKHPSDMNVMEFNTFGYVYYMLSRLRVEIREGFKWPEIEVLTLD